MKDKLYEFKSEEDLFSFMADNNLELSDEELKSISAGYNTLTTHGILVMNTE